MIDHVIIHTNNYATKRSCVKGLVEVDAKIGKYPYDILAPCLFALKAWLLYFGTKTTTDK